MLGSHSLKLVLFMAGAWCAFAQAKTPTACTGHRCVFAHYMLANQDYQADTDATQEAKILSYEHEIREAQAIGIDGFALNAGGWTKEQRYIRRAAQMFEAAVRLNSGFKLMFSADFCCGLTLEETEDMLRRFANNPRYGKAYFVYEGKAVLTTFAGDKFGTAAWNRLRKDLEGGQRPSTYSEPDVLGATGVASSKPLPVFVVPAFFWGGELPERATIERSFAEWKSVVDGLFYWGIAGVPGSGGALDQLRVSEAYARVAEDAGKIYMAPVCLQFWGANADRYYEYGGFAGMRKMWMDAIEVSHPEWVEIITWNDFVEGTYVSPIDDAGRYAGANDLGGSGIAPGTTGYFHSHAGAYELLRYFIGWYKTGIRPAIKNDAIYWAYRTHPANAEAGLPSVAHKYGEVADRIYVTAQLIAGAKLVVRSGGVVTRKELRAGDQDVEVPLAAGAAPVLELWRDGKLAINGVGVDRIEAGPALTNYYYSTGWSSSNPH